MSAFPAFDPDAEDAPIRIGPAAPSPSPAPARAVAPAPPPASLRSRLAATVARWYRLDDPLGVEAIRGRAYHDRRRLIRWSRWLVQGWFLLVCVAIGIEFARWASALEAGVVRGHRPPGVEGFLPISALLSARHLVATGTVHPIHPAGLVIFLLVVASGLLLKRAFCSWVCPVGTLSEIFAAVGRRVFGRKLRLPRWLDLPLRGVKYLLLAFFVWVIVFRMTPATIADFLDSPYNRVADLRMLDFFLHPSPLALKILGALALGSIVIPYFWCRYLCPYGALVGLLSLVSPLKVTRTAKSCIDCGLCTRACPSNLPVERLHRVTSDECFACMSCVAACPVPDALQIRGPGFWRRPVRPAWVAILVAILFGGGILAAKSAGVWQTSIGEREYLQRVQEMAWYQHMTGLEQEQPITAAPAPVAAP